jgi:cystathionine beta-lyase
VTPDDVIGPRDDPGLVELDTLRRRQSLKWTAFEGDVLPAWVAEMDFTMADPIREALELAIGIGDTGYPSAEAVGLGDAFAGFAGRQFGWEIDPDRVTAVGDVVGGISSLLELITDPGDGVIINPPVYHPFFTVIEQAGRRVIEVPLGDDNALDLAGIEGAIDAGAKAVLLCNPHNPTGSVLPAGDLESLAEIAVDAGVAVLSDEIHAPLVLDPTPHTPWLSVSDAARRTGFCLTSASKAFNLPGLSCAVIVTADHDRTADVGRLPFVAAHPSHLGVIASTAAFERCDDWLEGLRVRLRANRELLGELLAERVPEIRWNPPQAGYLAWLDCRELGPGFGRDPAALILERGRVALSGGIPFGPGGEGFCRLNFGTSPDLVEMVVDGISRAVADS